jgi:hypothetical protein
MGQPHKFYVCGNFDNSEIKRAIIRKSELDSMVVRNANL